MDNYVLAAALKKEGGAAQVNASTTWTHNLPACADYYTNFENKEKIHIGKIYIP